MFWKGTLKDVDRRCKIHWTTIVSISNQFHDDNVLISHQTSTKIINIHSTLNIIIKFYCIKRNHNRTWSWIRLAHPQQAPQAQDYEVQDHDHNPYTRCGSWPWEKSMEVLWSWRLLAVLLYTFSCMAHYLLPSCSSLRRSSPMASFLHCALSKKESTTRSQTFSPRRSSCERGLYFWSHC